MATMNDVARRAGVSLATVSAVMNRSAYVSPELTDRVHKAAAALRYRVNALARGLKQGSTRTVGMLYQRLPRQIRFLLMLFRGPRSRSGNVTIRCCWDKRITRRPNSRVTSPRFALV